MLLWMQIYLKNLMVSHFNIHGLSKNRGKSYQYTIYKVITLFGKPVHQLVNANI